MKKEKGFLEKPGISAVLLAPLSWLYAGGLALKKRRAARGGKFRPSCPVVSVGNITVGGTGKSPLVEVIASELAQNGLSPAVIRRSRAAWPFRRDLTDEERVFSENVPGVPQFSGEDKVECAQRACDSEADIMIVDDGFQTFLLERELDIVAVSAVCPFGNGLLLPSGRLREYPTALARAGVVIITNCEDISPSRKKTLFEAVRYYTEADVFESAYRAECLVNIRTGDTTDISELKGKRVAAFCGTGSPQLFFNCLEKLGAVTAPRTVFPDHHPYTERDVDDITSRKKDAGSEMIVTTQKDAVKLKQFGEKTDDINWLRVKVEIPRLDELVGMIQKKVKS